LVQAGWVRYEIEVRSFPTIGPAYPVSLEGGGYPRWRADGRELSGV
jgi:hypothetical protein